MSADSKITRVELASMAAGLASGISSWAQSLTTLPDRASQPVSRDTVERFLAEQRDKLNFIQELAGFDESTR